MESKTDWVSVEPKVWKYENAEDALEGVLTAKIENGGKFDNEAYVIENKEGSFTIFGTSMLERLMKLINVGDVVRIVYKGIGKNKRDEDMKLFEAFKQKSSEVAKQEGE